MTPFPGDATDFSASDDENVAGDARATAAAARSALEGAGKRRASPATHRRFARRFRRGGDESREPGFRELSRAVEFAGDDERARHLALELFRAKQREIALRARRVHRGSHLGEFRTRGGEIAVGPAARRREGTDAGFV